MRLQLILDKLPPPYHHVSSIHLLTTDLGFCPSNCCSAPARTVATLKYMQRLPRESWLKIARLCATLRLSKLHKCVDSPWHFYMVFQITHSKAVWRLGRPFSSIRSRLQLSSFGGPGISKLHPHSARLISRSKCTSKNLGTKEANS